MAMTLDPYRVQSRADLVEFLGALVEDLRARPNQVGNDTTVSYLDGLYGWAHGMDGYFLGRGEPPPTAPSWRLFAQMITAALVYE